MQAVQDVVRESKEDIFFGQGVILWARWFVILAIGVVIFTNVQNTGELALGMLPVAGLMVMNFYLHGKYLTETPVGPPLIVASSLIDLAIIIGMVAVGPGATGLSSQYYIFLYPLVLAFGFVMPRRVEAAYTVLVVVAYGLVCLPDILLRSTPLPIGVEIQLEIKGLFMRLLVLAAMGALGNYYWRIMRRRRALDLEAAATA